jgi:hypothetical protein
MVINNMLATKLKTRGDEIISVSGEIYSSGHVIAPSREPIMRQRADYQ